MKFFIVVFFKLNLGAFVFFTPEFPTMESCVVSATNPIHIQAYSKRMFMEYGKIMPIHSVACLPENEVKDLLTLHMKDYETEI